MQKKQEVTNCT